MVVEAKFHVRNLAPLIALMVCTVAVRVVLLLSSQRYLQSDEALVGMIALDIMEERGIPAFPYGNAYGGGHILEALMMTPLFAVLGPRDWIVSGVSAAMSCVYVGVVWWVVRGLMDRKTALVSGILFSLSAPYVAYSFYTNGAMTTGALAWTGLGLFFGVTEKSRLRCWRLFAAGCFLGLAYYGFDYAVFYAIAAGGLWWARERMALFRDWRGVGSLGSGFMLGAAPLLVFNLRHNFANWKNLMARTAEVSGVETAGFFRRGFNLLFHDLPAFFSTSIYDFQPTIGWLSWLSYWIAMACMIGCGAEVARWVIQKRVNRGGPMDETKGSSGIAKILFMTGLYSGLYCLSGSGGMTPRYLIPFFPLIPIVMARAWVRLEKRSRGMAWGMGLAYLAAQLVFVVQLAADRTTTEWKISTAGRDIGRLAGFLEARGLTTVVAPYEIKWKLMFESNRRIVCAAYLFGYDREERFNREVVERVNRHGVVPAFVFDRGYRMPEIAKNFNSRGAFDLEKFRERLKGARITFETTEVGDYVVWHGFSRSFALPDPYGEG